MIEDEITVFTDGASSGNPGPSGWAVMIGDEIHGGYMTHATNNFMELFAIFKAYELAPASSHILILSDSKWAILWAAGRMGCKKPNISGLIRAAAFTRRSKLLTVHFTLVKGHSGVKGNVAVDYEARRQARLARSIIG